MRTLSELYDILLTKYLIYCDNDNKNYAHPGLCHLISMCKFIRLITIKEEIKLITHLNSERKKYKCDYKKSDWWWEPYETIPRIKFLKSMITKTKRK